MKKFVDKKYTIKLSCMNYSHPLTVGLIRNCKQLLDTDLIIESDKISEKQEPGWAYLKKIVR